MSSLFIACRDLFLDDRYDVVCRLHTKKSPVEASRSILFKRHLEENLLNSAGYVNNVLDMFADNPWIGLAVPPIVHISYPTMGHAWFTNRPLAREVAKLLDLDVKFDDDTPVAAYGTMFWFRPRALRKLFAHPWKWEDFNAEPHHIDGGLAHVLERLIAYTAQDARFTTQHIACAHLAEHNYVSLEYKLQKILSCLPGKFRWQYGLVQKLVNQWREAGFPPGDSGQPSTIYESSWKRAWWSVAEPHKSPSQVDMVESSQPKANSQIASWRQYYIDRVERERSHARNRFSLSRIVDLKKLWRAKNDISSHWHDDSDACVIARFLLEASSVPFIFMNEQEKINEVNKYVLFGWSNSEEVLPLFDSNYYLNKNRDVAEAGVNPLVHFILHGGQERRNPHPLFDIEFYLTRNPQVAASSENPLAHFIRVGGAQGLSPHLLFDSAFYLDSNPEVRAVNLDPLVHYMLYGALEGRDPHPVFDTDYYSKTNPESTKGVVNALVHYVTVGCKEGRDPHPVFDTRHYVENYPEISAKSLAPITDFISVGGLSGRSPHALFDSAFYLKSYKEVAAFGANPLVHYLRWGAAEGRNPHELFDTRFYLSRYPEVATGGVNPLIHFVKWGIAEGRNPNSKFDSQEYQRRFRYVLKGDEIPFIHYFRNWRARSPLERVR